MAKQILKFPCGFVMITKGWFLMYDHIETIKCPFHGKDCKPFSTLDKSKGT